MKVKSLLVLATFVTGWGVAEAQNKKVAVFDPAGKAEEAIKEIVREEISTVIVNTDGYMVLERALIDKVLAESKFQQSGLVEDAQIGEVGKKMGADYVFVSSITPLGKNYHLSVKIIDVTTARIEKQKTASTEGLRNLTELIQLVVKDMLGYKEKKIKLAKENYEKLIGAELLKIREYVNLLKESSNDLAVEQSWSCGFPVTTDVVATLNKGILTIKGNGNFVNEKFPWENKTIKKRIKAVVVEDGVTAISSNAFRNCSDLAYVIISQSVTSIGDNAFQYCKSLLSIFIPNSVTIIGRDVFHACSSLSFVRIPNSVTNIGEGAFRSCNNLDSIAISNTLDIISNNLFDGCFKLVELLIPNTVTSIGSNAFKNCTSLTFINIPDSVKTIEDYTFYGCRSLGQITIPTTVISIGASAFDRCSSLFTVTIPSNVVSIDKNAFNDCRNLLSIICLNPIPPKLGGRIVSKDYLTTISLYVPPTSVHKYQSARNWENIMMILPKESNNNLKKIIKK